MVRIWAVGADGSLDSSALQQVLESHTGPVYCVRWSPDGYLASASVDSTVRIWAKGTNTPLESMPQRILHGHNNSVLTVAWAFDGSLLASGSEDSTVRIWDMNTEGGDPVVQVLEGRGSYVSSVSWSPDSTRIASVSDSAVWIWASANSSSSRSNFTMFQLLDDRAATIRVAFSHLMVRLWLLPLRVSSTFGECMRTGPLALSFRSGFRTATLSWMSLGRQMAATLPLLLTFMCTSG